MIKSNSLSHFAWTAATIGGSAAVRFGQNVVLSRLLVPEILGVMVVVNSVRLGIELLTDVGVEQNVVHHADGLERNFRDTAWTLQVIRGVFLGTAFLAASPFLAGVYGIDQHIFMAVACVPAIGALHSTAIFALVKNLQVRNRSLFELSTEVVGAIVTIVLAFVLRSVWAPVIGLIATVMFRAALSFSLPDARQRFAFDPEVFRRIVRFGKWIALTSLVVYAATSADRLYLGQVVPLGVLGIYGIARAIADLPTILARRIGYQVIFPSLTGSGRGGDDLGNIGATRLLFVLAACGGVAAAAACADLLIALVYDQRYHQAGWMLATLLLGGIFAILSNLNETLLLVVGRPSYASYANVARLLALGAGLTVGFTLFGLPGAVAAVALAEVCQYFFIAIAQRRIDWGFWRSDLAAILFSLAVFAAIFSLRAAMGWGSPFAGLPVIGR